MYQLKLQIAVQVEKNFASVGQLLETQEQSPSNCQKGCRIHNHGSQKYQRPDPGIELQFSKNGKIK